MSIRKTIFSLLASWGLVSCVTVPNDQNASQILIGRVPSELFEAFGEPQQSAGELANGKMQWEGYSCESDLFNDDPTDFYYVYYDVKSLTKNGRIIAIDYQSSNALVSTKWRRKNAWFMDLYNACAANSIEEVKIILAYLPPVPQPDLIAQATAQAVRYKGVELARYLISTYKVDINKNIVTWRTTGDDYDFFVKQEITTIAKLMQEYGVAL